jgi:flagellar biosynthesis protein FlhF
MQLEMFRGQELRSVVAWVHRSLGADAMIIRTNVLKRPDGDVYEVVAARPQELEEYNRTLSEGPVSIRIAERRGTRPYVIALVGPPGAGKTTATVKLALHPRGVGGRKVGLMTLDTYRVGGVEELQTYAEIAGLPLEVVYHAREVEAALERLAHLEAVIVDTPGRSTNGSGWFYLGHCAVHPPGSAAAAG